MSANNSKYTEAQVLASLKNKGAFVQGNEIFLYMTSQDNRTPIYYGIRMWGKIDFLKNKGYVFHI